MGYSPATERFLELLISAGPEQQQRHVLVFVADCIIEWSARVAVHSRDTDASGKRYFRDVMLA